MPEHADVHIHVWDGTGKQKGWFCYSIKEEYTGHLLHNGVERSRHECIQAVHRWAMRQGYTSVIGMPYATTASLN